MARVSPILAPCVFVKVAYVVDASAILTKNGVAWLQCQSLWTFGDTDLSGVNILDFLQVVRDHDCFAVNETAINGVLSACETLGCSPDMILVDLGR